MKEFFRKASNSMGTTILILTVVFLVILFYPSDDYEDIQSIYTDINKMSFVQDVATGVPKNKERWFNEETGDWEERDIPDPSSPLPAGGNYPEPTHAYFPMLDSRYSHWRLMGNPDPSSLPGGIGGSAPTGSNYGGHAGVDMTMYRRYEEGGDLYSDDAMYGSAKGYPQGGAYITSAKAGTVVLAVNETRQNMGLNTGSYGTYVAIAHPDKTLTLYGHMYPGSLRVAAGQTVRAGDVLGLMSTTGSSNAVHLHFDTRMIRTSKVTSSNINQVIGEIWEKRMIHNRYIRALDQEGISSSAFSLVLYETVPDDEAPKDVMQQWKKNFSDTNVVHK